MHQNTETVGCLFIYITSIGMGLIIKNITENNHPILNHIYEGIDLGRSKILMQKGRILRFAFGKNWQSFSKKAFTPERVMEARQAFRRLVSGIPFQGKRFIDTGFGRGIALVAAAEMGAEVLGIDIDRDNWEALETTQQAMDWPAMPATRFVSILNEPFVQDAEGQYNIVHAWGVLHHTGDMKRAIENSCRLVDPKGGYFICAIYNHHWTSPIWNWIKWSYNILPKVLQQVLIVLFYPAIYTAKWAVTGENPMKMDRGMNFFHDVVDWIGGYPYEYASRDEIETLVGQQGFQCLSTQPAQVPTGCNVFVFQRTDKRFQSRHSSAV
jgi:2-polyprenyl-3-methyl-5-hydroxy-6-metoxy-1,4-benzoquinol methylase